MNKQKCGGSFKTESDDVNGLSDTNEDMLSFWMIWYFLWASFCWNYLCYLFCTYLLSSFEPVRVFKLDVPTFKPIWEYV